MYKILFAIMILAVACNEQPNSAKNTTKQAKPQSHKTNYKISLKIDDKIEYVVGDKIPVDYKINSKLKPDSLRLMVNNSFVADFIETPIVWNSVASKTGKQKVSVVFYWGDSIKQTASKSIILKSDIEPKRYTYKIVESWAHDTKAYTQGLEFNNGYLYEGTGQYGESMLTKVKLETNEIIQSTNLSKEVFGEGITILNDKIYQLTWKSSIGYVYDKETFNTLYEFSYPTDGWGLTNNGKELIMSDGSENIYFLDSEYFNELRRIQVYDNIGPVYNLNELELINGEIYANIYGTKKIVAFSPETGKVTKIINLNSILKNEDITSQIDVMNGIAWEAEKQMLVITGKWWPKLYHIELIEE